MRRRSLGRSGIEITEFGFGGAPLGGMYSRVEDAAARAALAAAWDAGIRYFDTAPLYGSGLSERRFGEFLQTKPRAEYILSTKVGRTLHPATGHSAADGSLATFFGGLPSTATFDFSARGIEASLAQSSERLGIDRIDLVFLHDPEQHIEEAIDVAYPVLDTLRRRGAIAAIGIGTNHVSVAEEFVRRCDLDACMAAGRYTLLDRSAAATLLPLCAQRNVAFIAGGVFNSGILSRAQPIDDATFNYVPAQPAMLECVRRLANICRQYGWELPAAALQFPLTSAVTAGALVGMRSPHEVHANMQHCGRPLPPALLQALDDEVHRCAASF